LLACLQLALLSSKKKFKDIHPLLAKGMAWRCYLSRKTQGCVYWFLWRKNF
jgi:hypothetical protein